MRKILCTLCALVMLLTLVGACKPKDPQNLDGTPKPTDNAQVITHTLSKPMLFGDIEYYGDTIAALATDGTVTEYTDGTAFATDIIHTSPEGKTTVGYSLLAIESVNGLTVGIDDEGNVYHSSYAEGYDELDAWTGIIKIAVGGGFVAGINNEGKLFVTGPDAPDISGVTNAFDIDAYGSILAIVSLKGGVSVVETAYDVTTNTTSVSNLGKLNTALQEIKNGVRVSVSATHVAVLQKDAKVAAFSLDGTSTADYCAVEGLADVKQVLAAKAATVVLKKDGSVVSVPANANLSEQNNIAMVTDNGEGAYALMTRDGKLVTVSATGEVATVGGAQLRPVLTGDENNLIEGFIPGTSTASALSLLSDMLGTTNVKIEAAGKADMTKAVATGIIIKVDDKDYATVVIHGDVNGDGAITTDDAAQLEEEANDTGRSDSPAVILAGNVNGYTGADAAIQIKQYLLRGDRIAQFTIKPIEQVTGDPQAVVLDSYEAALSVNPDVVGFINVPNTNIKYPILYGRDWYYNDHDIYRNKSNAGSIYSYYNVLAKNNPITGHNMRQAGTMFHALHEIQNNASSLQEYSNRIWTINLFGRNAKWEVFSIYEVPHDEPTSTLLYNTQTLSSVDDATIMEWINTQISRSEVNLGVTPSPRSTFVTLITCGDNFDYDEAQSRLYVFLRMVG